MAQAGHRVFQDLPSRRHSRTAAGSRTSVQSACDAAPWDKTSEGPPLHSETSLASVSTQSSNSQVPLVPKRRRSKKDTKKPSSIIVPSNSSVMQGSLQYFLKLLKWSGRWCSAETKPATPESARSRRSNISPLPSPGPSETSPQALDELVRKRPFANRFILYSLEVDAEVSPGCRAWLASDQPRVQPRVR